MRKLVTYTPDASVGNGVGARVGDAGATVGSAEAVTTGVGVRGAEDVGPVARGAGVGGWVGSGTVHAVPIRTSDAT